MGESILIKPGQQNRALLPGMVELPDVGKNAPMGSGTVTSLISSGGMAIIYEIWNPDLEVTRAVKLLHPDHSADSEDRFYTEMKISAKLHHPNIVEIYSVGKWNNLPYIEMERINGLTLEKTISDKGALPLEVCTAIGIMVGRALNYAHNQHYVIFGSEYQGIIHRDLKPGNIMVASDGIVKLMDFGIAKPVTANTHTIEGMVMGTMQYLAPEQLDGKDIDMRADIYALGTVLYEMLTGAQTFPDTNIGKLVTAKLHNNYIPLETFKIQIPPTLSALVHKCMRYEKEKRVQNMLEFLHTIGAIHKAITPLSPEAVMAAFMQSHNAEKKSIGLKPRTTAMSNKATAVLIVSCIGLATVILWFSLVYGQALLKPLFRNHSQAIAPVGIPAATSQNPPRDIFAPDTTRAATALKSADRADVSPSDTAKGFHNVDIKFIPKEAPKTLFSRKATKPITQNAIKSILTTSNEPTPSALSQSTNGDQIPSGDLVERLSFQYKTRSILTLFTGEVESAHFQNALALYPMVQQDDALTKKIKIYRMRCLSGVNDRTRLQAYLDAQEIFDGEFYLEKAKDSRLSKNMVLATEMIRKASVSPAAFLSSRVFRESLEFEKATIASAVFDISPSETNKQGAFDAWNTVKALMRSYPEHQYFLKADAEIKRITSP